MSSFPCAGVGHMGEGRASTSPFPGWAAAHSLTLIDAVRIALLSASSRDQRATVTSLKTRDANDFAPRVSDARRFSADGC